jgi:death-on-curing protein
MLGPDWVEYVHNELIHKFWTDNQGIGSRGVKNRGLLESAVARPFQTAFGDDAYATILDKAAALFHSLVANHPFHDGNKRTAVIALHHFLIANAYLIVLSNEEAYTLAKSTASYRERGLAHEEIFREITNALNSRTITFSQLRSAREESGAGPYFKEIYREVFALRQKIRRSSLNRLTPSGKP